MSFTYDHHQQQAQHQPITTTTMPTSANTSFKDAQGDGEREVAYMQPNLVSPNLLSSHPKHTEIAIINVNNKGYPTTLNEALETSPNPVGGDQLHLQTGAHYTLGSLAGDPIALNPIDARHRKDPDASRHIKGDRRAQQEANPRDKDNLSTMNAALSISSSIVPIVSEDMTSTSMTILWSTMEYYCWTSPVSRFLF